MGRAKEMNRAVKNYDSCLYVQENPDGRLDLYRQNRDKTSPPHFVFSLTDSWTPTGRPIDYGVEPVLNRLRAHDLWRDDRFVEEWIKEHEKSVESAERSRRNSVEDFLYDFRNQFHRTFNDVNTSNMDKTIYRED